MFGKKCEFLSSLEDIGNWHGTHSVINTTAGIGGKFCRKSVSLALLTVVKLFSSVSFF